MISGVTFHQYSEAKQRNSNIILSVKFRTVNCQYCCSHKQMVAHLWEHFLIFSYLQNNPVTNNADETLLSLRKRIKSPWDVIEFNLIQTLAKSMLVFAWKCIRQERYKIQNLLYYENTPSDAMSFKLPKYWVNYSTSCTPV